MQAFNFRSMKPLRFNSSPILSVIPVSFPVLSWNFSSRNPWFCSGIGLALIALSFLYAHGGGFTKALKMGGFHTGDSV